MNHLKLNLIYKAVVNKGEPVSIGDTWNSNIVNLQKSLDTSSDFSHVDTSVHDMTYGIIQPEHFNHNNMQINTTQKDIGNSESNNVEYNMYISGFSKLEYKKRSFTFF